jgi:ABC-2 type transport system ATP-binding protein
MSDDVAIKVDHVSKTFKLPHEKTTSIKGAVVSFWRRDKSYEQQRALDDISFEVKKGEFFGIVGRNGSGKSTLLKMLAGIYSPSEGNITVNGKLTPFIELGVGFNPELTGRENVYLNGALLGFDRKDMRRMYKDIVEFAELERFMDQKLKNYSSGMQVRLAFSIAIRAKSDILLIDEVLAVGDEAFQRKCFKYFKQLKKESKTVVFVTHDMSSFEKYCDTGILIDSGNLVFTGETLLISAEYKMANLTRPKKIVDRNAKLDFDGAIKTVTINGSDKALLKRNDLLDISIEIVPTKTIEVTAGISIILSDGTYVGFHSTRDQLGKIKATQGKKINLRYRLPVNELLPGTYTIDVALYDSKNYYVDLKTKIGVFVVEGKDKSRAGLVKLVGEWQNAE